jgi:streptogramin lyase
LIEYDQSSGKCRHFGIPDGLAMNQILSTRVLGNRLWLGYPKGIGFFDLSSGKFTSFTPSIVDNADTQRSNSNAGQHGSPPSGPVESIVAGPDGEIWFSVGYWVGRYHPAENSWERVSQIDIANHLESDANHLFAAQSRDYSFSKGGGPLGLTILDFQTGQCRSLPEIEGLPGYSVTAMAVDGNDLWVGGYGYIASFDMTEGKIRKFAYVHSEEIDRVQIGVGGGYVWALFGQCLYRAALSRF